MLFNGVFFFILVVIVRPVGASYSDVTHYRRTKSSLLYSFRFYISLPIFRIWENSHETRRTHLVYRIQKLSKIF